MKELEIQVEHYSTPKHLHKEYCNRKAEHIYECNFYDTRVCQFTCRYAKVMNQFKKEAEEGLLKMAGMSLECI